MGFCMTKTILAVKLGHFSTVFRASLLLISSFCSSVALSADYFKTDNGMVDCQIDWSDGTITCSGTDSDVNSYCVDIVQNLAQYQYNIVSDTQSAIGQLNECHKLLIYVRDTTRDNTIKPNLNTCIGEVDSSLHYSSNVLTSASSMYNYIKAVDCSRCSSQPGEDGNYGCLCSNELEKIEIAILDISTKLDDFKQSFVEAMSLVNSTLSDISDDVSDISSYAETISSNVSTLNNRFVSLLGKLGGDSFSLSGASSYLDMTSEYRQRLYSLYLPSGSNRNILNYLNTLTVNNRSALSSINNYLSYFLNYSIPPITNELHNVYSASTNILSEVRSFHSDATNYFNEVTNYFSFFRDSISVRSVLEDWTPSDGAYYDFLTNYYLRVANNDSSLSSTSKTNWFSRIETLLASLVFSDSVKSTNTVDLADATSESQTIQQSTLDTLDGFSSASSDQLDSFRETSQNVLSSLRSISSSFSSVADPGTVELVSFSSSGSRDSSDSVSFETSDIRNLVEACHCVTTLCWCFGGLLLLYYFLHWTVKTSYGLLVFAWGVVGSIFKH